MVWQHEVCFNTRPAKSQFRPILPFCYVGFCVCIARRVAARPSPVLLTAAPPGPSVVIGLCFYFWKMRSKVMENNPQIRHILSDPAVLRQYVDMALNPEVGGA